MQRCWRTAYARFVGEESAFDAIAHRPQLCLRVSKAEQKVFAFADNHPLIRDLTVYSNFINQF